MPVARRLCRGLQGGAICPMVEPFDSGFSGRCRSLTRGVVCRAGFLVFRPQVLPIDHAVSGSAEP